MFNQNYTQIRVKMRFPPINKTDTSTDMTKKSFFLILLFDKIKTKNNLKYVLYPKLYVLYEKSFWVAHETKVADDSKVSDSSKIFVQEWLINDLLRP